MKTLRYLLFLIICLFLYSCGSMKHMNVLCNFSDVEIYIDGQYIGKGLVSYNVPQGANTIEITCMYNGKEVAKRIVPVKNKTLYEVYLSDDFLYSTNPILYKSK